MSKDSKTWTYEGFLAATAKALWEIHQAKRLQSRTSEVLGAFGIAVPDDAKVGEPPAFAFPLATEPEDTYIGHGTTLADLSPEARQRREAKRVRQLRQQVYAHLVSMVGYGQDAYCARGEDCPNHGGRGYKLAEVVRHFDALGFPQPKESTRVEAIIRQGDSERYIYATVPGRMTVEEARAKLEPLAAHSPEHLDTIAAFGEGSHPEDLVKTLRVNVSTDWTDSEDIK